jgi:circadian clock protein KaiB
MTYVLRLFVTGKTPRAEVAIANIQRICEEELKGEYRLDIIDVLEHPEEADNERVLATPTLIKQLPPPLRRVIGDLTDKEKVLFGLALRPFPPGQEKDE